MPLDPSFARLLQQPRAELHSFVVSFLGGSVEPGPAADQIASDAMEVLAAASDADQQRLIAYLDVLGSTFGAWDADPLARRLYDVMFGLVVAPESSLRGAEHLDRAIATGRPVMIAGNHLSYADASVTLELLRRHASQAADQLTAVAGPKVYTSLLRLLGAAAMHTIKVAQSQAVATDQEPMGPREIARAARTALDDAQRLTAAGRIVLVYPEGTRSRTGAMGPFLKATGRWVTLPDLLVVPLALRGSDGCHAIAEGPLRPHPVHARLGPAVDTAALMATGAGRGHVLEAVRRAVEGELTTLDAAITP